MSKTLRRNSTIRGLYIFVLFLGALQLLNLYQINIQTVVDYQGLSSRDHGTERTITHPPNKSTRSPEAVELLRRKLSVNRTNVRRHVQTSKVALDLSLLDMKGERFYKQVGTDIPLRRNPSRFLRPFHNPVVYGIERTFPGYITIGIPSVKRPNTDKIYIFETLDSLVKNVEEVEKPSVTVVVLLSDPNTTYSGDLGNKLYRRYTRSIDSGFIRIIQPPSDIYPNFDKIRPTFNDPILRVKWRAKQNIDFAYLNMYSRNISKYYIQIEDDVVTSENLITDIKNFTSMQMRKWFLLEFSRLGYIGKMFHSDDLLWTANFLLTFFDKMPCDLLLGKMRGALGQPDPIHSPRSLFQHVGKFSSLKNKIMPSLDDRFKDAGKIGLSANELPSGSNPPVFIDTNMKAANNTKPMDAYNNDAGTFFWVLAPTLNNYLLLTFNNACNFTRIIIITGDADTKHDSLKSGGLYYSKAQHQTLSGKTKCSKFEPLVNFVGGEIDTQAMGVNIPLNIQCLKILVRVRSKNWVKFRNIVLI